MQDPQYRSFSTTQPHASLLCFPLPLIQCPHSHKDLGAITLMVTILALTYFEHLGYTEFHVKGFLYISSFDYHNPMNWLVLFTLFYRQGRRLREINNVLKLAFFFPTSIHLSPSSSAISLPRAYAHHCSRHSWDLKQAVQSSHS